MYERVALEVDARVLLLPEGVADDGPPGGRVVVGSTGERLRIEQDVDVPRVAADLAALRADGIEAVAIVLMHAYTFAAHEQVIAVCNIYIKLTSSSSHIYIYHLRRARAGDR